MLSLRSRRRFNRRTVRDRCQRGDVFRAARAIDRARGDLRPGDDDRRRPVQQGRVLRRRGVGRRVEDRERRRVVAAGVRHPGLVLDRLGHPRPASTRTSSGSAPASAIAALRRATATASTRATTAAARGRTSGSRTPSTSAASSSTRRTATRCTSRRRGRSGRPAAIAGSTRRPTAARPGTRC